MEGDEDVLRLAHRILSQPIQLMADGNTDESRRQNRIADTMRRELRRGCPVIIADNVSEYTYREYNCALQLDQSQIHYGRQGEWSLDRVGCLCPPFMVFFIEWRVPDEIRRMNARVVPAAGWFIVVTPPDAECLKVAPDAKHTLICAHCFQRLSGQPAVSGTTRNLAVNDAGAPLRVGGTEGPDYHYLSESMGSLSIALQTIGFMNCRNVKCYDVSKTEGPSSKWCRRQKLPELKYHVLQIDPNLGSKPRTEGRKTEGNRSGKALHICRGHFAHFVDDGLSQGLFGRRQFGTFWISAHTRGTLKHGRVVSIYEVKAPSV